MKKKKEGSVLRKQIKSVQFQYSLHNTSALFTYNYSLGVLKKVNEQNLSSSFIFYLQLKALYTESNIKKGFGIKISESLKISKTSVSLKLNKLVKEGFATKTKTGYYLASYSTIYASFKLDNHYRTFNTIKIKSAGMLSKKQLKERLEELEIISYGCVLKESSLKGGAESSIANNLTFQSDYITMGAKIAKSKATCFKVVRRILRKTHTRKKQNKTSIDPLSLSDQEKLHIKTYGGKTFFSERFGYSKQEANSYSFLFKSSRSQKHTLFNKSICDTLQRKLYKSSENAL